MAAFRRLTSVSHHLVSHRTLDAVAAAAEGEDEDEDEPTLQAALAAVGHEEPLPLVAWEEIALHRSRDDVWVVVDGVVFDMTEFIGSDHPGGDAIPMDYAGKDASEYWNEVHAGDGGGAESFSAHSSLPPARATQIWE